AVAAAPPPRASTTTVYSSSYPGDFLACVRQRESGGNYGVYNSGGSGAAGAYQFMPGTWNSIAASSGRGDLVGLDPAQASPADQDALAQALYAQQGAAPWGGGCRRYTDPARGAEAVRRSTLRTRSDGSSGRVLSRPARVPLAVKE